MPTAPWLPSKLGGKRHKIHKTPTVEWLRPFLGVGFLTRYPPTPVFRWGSAPKKEGLFAIVSICL